MGPPSRLAPERTTSKSPWGLSQGPANQPEIRVTRGVAVTSATRRPKEAKQPVAIRRILLIKGPTGFIMDALVRWRMVMGCVLDRRQKSDRLSYKSCDMLNSPLMPDRIRFEVLCSGTSL